MLGRISLFFIDNREEVSTHSAQMLVAAHMDPILFWSPVLSVTHDLSGMRGVRVGPGVNHRLQPFER